jgi:2-C-methyl-D-erythritol 2,4-cyclodiphosphate synthase
MGTHRDAMRENIARAMGLSADCVNVKAKTAERLGPVGQLQAIEARAVVLVSALA